MVRIKSAQFIGVSSAGNSSRGEAANAICYSVLVEYEDGTRTIREGDAKSMEAYLPYIRDESNAQSVQEAFAGLIDRMEQIIDSRIQSIFEMCYPIPDVVGMREDIAAMKLKEAGFRVEQVNRYPVGMPLGIVEGCWRDETNYLTVLLDVCHELPNVLGLTEKMAMDILTCAGFRYEKEYMDSFDLDFRVVECVRKNPRGIDVILRLASSKLAVVGMEAIEAQRMLEAAGIPVDVEVVSSARIPAGQVKSWARGDVGIILYVSGGALDIWSTSGACSAHSDEGTELNCQNVRAKYNLLEQKMTIEMECVATSKTRHIFKRSGVAHVGGDVIRVQVDNIEQAGSGARKSRMFIITEKCDCEDNQPSGFTMALKSNYGLFKVESHWKLDFAFTW